MKNAFRIVGDTAIIYLTRRDATTFQTTIDREDLPIADSLKGRWTAFTSPTPGRRYVAGHVREHGRRRTVSLHRLIAQAPDGLVVDHIDGDTLNNRKANLRVADKSLNGLNRTGLPRHNTSGVLGVSWSKNARRWTASISVDGKQTWLGFYEDIEEAGQVVEEARRRAIQGMAILA